MFTLSPHDTLEKAATKIKTVTDILASGDEVLIYPGTYTQADGEKSL